MRWTINKIKVLVVTYRKTSCYNDGRDRPHHRRRIDRFIVFAWWRRCAPPFNASFSNNNNNNNNSHDNVYGAVIMTQSHCENWWLIRVRSENGISFDSSTDHAKLCAATGRVCIVMRSKTAFVSLQNVIGGTKAVVAGSGQSAVSGSGGSTARRTEQDRNAGRSAGQTEGRIHSSNGRQTTMSGD